MTKNNFPLVWLCLGLTLIGVMLAFFVAYRRPEMEVLVPGSEIAMDDGTNSPNQSYEEELSEITKTAELCEPIVETMVLNVSARE